MNKFARQAATFAVIGAALMMGAKIIDWAIPHAPRVIKVEIKDERCGRETVWEKSLLF